MNFGYLGALRQRRRHLGQMHDRYRLWGSVPLRNHSAMDSSLVLCPCRWSTLFGRLRYQLPRPRHFRRAKTSATAQHCTSQPPGRRRGDQVTYRTVYPPPIGMLSSSVCYLPWPIRQERFTGTVYTPSQAPGKLSHQVEAHTTRSIFSQAGAKLSEDGVCQDRACCAASGFDARVSLGVQPLSAETSSIMVL